MSEKENRKSRDILISVETHVKYIGQQIKEIKEDKKRQWTKIDTLNSGLNRVIGAEGIIGAIVIGIVIKLIAF